MPNATLLPLPAIPAGRPHAPLAPVLSVAALRGAGGTPLPGLLDAPYVHQVTSGRIAIALALAQMGVGLGDTVLMPAYHSQSMIPPVLWRGATPRFYRVGMDTAVDLDDIAAKLDISVKALVVTHYFGFAQDLTAIRAWCDRHGVQLLEDCAHCLLGERDGVPVGSVGDYAIGSTMKFYPVYEGGCLVSWRRPMPALALHGAGAGFEAKAALAALEHGFAYGRMPQLKKLLALPLALKDWLWHARKAGSSTPSAPLVPTSSDSSYEFDPRWIDKRSSRFTRLMLRLASRERIATLRRRQYQLLADAVQGLPGCRSLHPALPSGTCPWVFPLLVDEPERVFARLVSEGVPVVRFGNPLWPGVDANVCPSSAALSRAVLGFPCHQGLRPAELTWIALRLRAAFAV